jgi:hypothetical protein
MKIESLDQLNPKILDLKGSRLNNDGRNSALDVERF